MPKSFSEQERAMIQKRLKEEGTKCLAQYGVLHTTVDEIVKRANIPKGTFYLFYKSKELLLFDIIVEYHTAVEEEIKRRLADINPDTCTAEELAHALVEIYRKGIDNPIMKLMNSADMEILIRKLPPEVIANHNRQDESMIQNIFDALKANKSNNLEAFSVAFQSLYFLTLHRENFEPEQFDQAFYYLVYGLVLQLMD